MVCWPPPALNSVSESPHFSGAGYRLKKQEANCFLFFFNLAHPLDLNLPVPLYSPSVSSAVEMSSLALYFIIFIALMNSETQALIICRGRICPFPVDTTAVARYLLSHEKMATSASFDRGYPLGHHDPGGISSSQRRKKPPRMPDLSVPTGHSKRGHRICASASSDTAGTCSSKLYCPEIHRRHSIISNPFPIPSSPLLMK